MERFFSYIGNFVRLSDESRDALASVVRPMDLPKGYSLLRPGGICQHFYFIEKGLTRTYYLKDGKDVTDWISVEGTIAVSHADLERLYLNYHDIERLGRLMVSAGIIELQQRFDDLHFATARERYEKLIATQPSLINRVPLGVIASYLGITQETLSRIRAQY